VDQESRCN